MCYPRRFLFLFLFVIAANLALADDLNRQLHDNYVNKVLVVRGFYSGDHLRYDASGSLVSRNPSSDWTSDGIVLITDIGVKGHEIKIKTRRMSVVSQNKSLTLRTAENETVRPGESKAIALEIAVDLGTRHPSAGQADAAMAGIFLSPKDDFASMVPDYWKPCVVEGLAGTSESCRFAPDMLGVLGLSVPNAKEAKISDPNVQKESSAQVFRVGYGVSPPKLTLHKEPEFSELARRMKYQGTGVLGLTVDQQGIPRDVHVLTPLGCGLDAQGVYAVEGWRFKPAEKDGHPVAVVIAVEVDFHLY